GDRLERGRVDESDAAIAARRRELRTAGDASDDARGSVGRDRREARDARVELAQRPARVAVGRGVGEVRAPQEVLGRVHGAGPAVQAAALDVALDELALDPLARATFGLRESAVRA